MRERLGEPGATTRVVALAGELLDRVTLKVPPAAARAGRGPAVRLLATSWRIKVAHEERWREVSEAGRPIVFLLWHEALLPLLWHHRDQGVDTRGE